MNTALRLEDFFVSPEQYLAAEQLSLEKHEYVAGKVYAKAITSAGHERISNNIIGEQAHCVTVAVGGIEFLVEATEGR